MTRLNAGIDLGTTFTDTIFPDLELEASRLTEDPRTDQHPVWSADGNTITFVSNREGGFIFDLYTMRTTGSEITQITDLGAFIQNPTLAP